MGFPVVLLKATALHCTRSTVTADNAIPTELTTFHFVAEKLAVVHRDERVAEEGAEEIEERNDAVGVLKRHGGPSGDQLQQRHHGADGAERESEGHVYTKYIDNNNLLLVSVPGDHFGCHGSYQVPEMPQETCVES